MIKNTLKTNHTVQAFLPYEIETPFKNLIESLKTGVYMADVNGVLLYANQAYADIVGYRNKNEVLGLKLADELYTNPKDRLAFLKAMKKNGFVKDYEVENTRKDGTVVVLSVTSNFIKNEEGRIIGTEGIIRDITRQKKADEELKILQKNLQIEKKKLEQVLSIDQKISSILELNHLVDFIIEKATKILEAERCSLMLKDPDTEELLIKGAKGVKDQIIKKTRIKPGEQIAGLVAQRGKPVLVTDAKTSYPIVRDHRFSYRSTSFLSVPIKLHEKIVGVVNVTDKKPNKKGSFNEIDLKILSSVVRQAAIAIENASYYRELEYLSTSDPLTGLYNHRYFTKSLDQEISRIKRYPGNLCLLMADIDDFKTYNDTFGHLEGDRLLKKVAEVLRKSLRNVDIICRYAGDEFVAILPETDIAQAKKVSEKIKHGIENILLNKEITVSIGVASCSPRMDRRDLIMRADQALYQAKRAGKDLVRSFD